MLLVIENTMAEWVHACMHGFATDTIASFSHHFVEVLKVSRKILPEGTQ